MKIPKKKQRKKLPSLRSIHKRAWALFSEYVRRKDADHAGYVRCITCGKADLWNSGLIHAGHYIHNKLDFDEMNVNPQCQQENYYQKGSPRIYALKLVEKYGLEAVKDLERRAHQHPGYKRHELLEIIELYKQRLKEYD